MLDLAGFDLESRANKIFLPTTESLHPTRSIHLGRHTTVAIQEVQMKMDDILNFGKSLGWSRNEYQCTLRSMLSNSRQELRAGKIALNINMRPWANIPTY